jgi:hypothetical protein
MPSSALAARALMDWRWISESSFRRYTPGGGHSSLPRLSTSAVLALGRAAGQAQGRLSLDQAFVQRALPRVVQAAVQASTETAGIGERLPAQSLRQKYPHP